MLSSNKKPQFIENPLSPVEFAFTSGEVDYYQHVDPFAAPCLRALSALTAYEELRKRTTRELDLKEVDALLSEVKKAMASIEGGKGTIRLTDTFKALQNIEWIASSKKQRLELIFEPETAYKLAAVVFFDENESPLRYDAEYGRRKIEKWKKDESLKDFFLRQPLRRLIPFSDDFAPNLEIYSGVVQKMISQMSDNLSGMISNSPSTTAQEAT